MSSRVSSLHPFVSFFLAVNLCSQLVSCTIRIFWRATFRWDSIIWNITLEMRPLFFQMHDFAIKFDLKTLLLLKFSQFISHTTACEVLLLLPNNGSVRVNFHRKQTVKWDVMCLTLFYFADFLLWLLWCGSSDSLFSLLVFSKEMALSKMKIIGHNMNYHCTVTAFLLISEHGVLLYIFCELLLSYSFFFLIIVYTVATVHIITLKRHDNLDLFCETLRVYCASHLQCHTWIKCNTFLSGGSLVAIHHGRER